MEVYVGTQTISYSGLTPDELMTYTFYDQQGTNDITGSATTDNAGELVIVLPEDTYHHWYMLSVDDSVGMPVIEDSVDIVRPYAKPEDIVAYTGGKATLETAVEYEAVARYIIDSIVGAHFQYENKSVAVNGNGTDFLTFDERLIRVFSVKKNNEIVWESDDTSYDGVSGGFYPVNHYYSMTFVPLTEATNAMESARSWSTRYSFPLFPDGYDYVVSGLWGWPVIPEDIRKAALMLINDIACGNNRYSNKYIDSFRNGTVTIDHFKEVIKGTGNVIVDTILSKYVTESVRVKVL